MPKFEAREEMPICWSLAGIDMSFGVGGGGDGGGGGGGLRPSDVKLVRAWLVVCECRRSAVWVGRFTGSWTGWMWPVGCLTSSSAQLFTTLLELGWAGGGRRRCWSFHHDDRPPVGPWGIVCRSCLRVPPAARPRVLPPGQVDAVDVVVMAVMP